MKKILIITLIAFVIGCKNEPTRQQLVEQSIKTYILENIDNPDKYEPISFDPIDTLYTSYYDDFTYREYESAKDNFERNKNFYEQYKGDKFMGTFYRKEMLESEKEYKSLEAAADSIKKNFMPEIDYIICRHTYRAENKFGAIVKETELFYLDPDNLIVKRHL